LLPLVPMNKIIHIVDYPQGNPWIENQMMYLSSHGIRQSLISIDNDGELLKNLQERDITELYKCHFNIVGCLLIGKKLKKQNDKFKQIVYAHGHKPSAMALILKLVFGLDYVISHHHPPHWIDMFQQKHKFRGRYHQLLRDKYYKHALAIQAFSSEANEYLESRGDVDGRVLRIPLGVDFRRFKDEPSEISHRNRPTRKLRILTVSRLAWEKRIDLCLESAHELSKLGVDFEYSIIGDGPLMQPLLKKRDELGLKNRVSLLGWVDNISDFYKENDVLLHLSATESFGQVLLEARLHGLFVLTSPCGIALDMALVKDPEFKILTQTEPKSIAEEVIRLPKLDRNKLSIPEVIDLYQEQEFFKVQEKLRIALNEMFEGVT
jgi:glycosyltransferase involved in cell wall biosynthesis